ncbi:glycosyltransferase family 2 protein [Anaerobacillus sp. HL2]|nr:glycosyltransferase family 2 protein [Anaerobacillus sp. HL2]
MEASLRTQLAQTYKNIEWIVVNDRSTDETGTIIDKLSMEDERIKPVHIEILPEGWLGKIMRFMKVFLQAKGDYILLQMEMFILKKILFQKR